MALLNLGKVVGPQGEPGPQGDPGPQGPPGPQGEPGEIVDVNNYLDGLRFGKNEEGKWGYIPPGADTVIPFSDGSGSGSGDFAKVLDTDDFWNMSSSFIKLDGILTTYAEIFYETKVGVV